MPPPPAHCDRARRWWPLAGLLALALALALAGATVLPTAPPSLASTDPAPAPTIGTPATLAAQPTAADSTEGVRLEAESVATEPASAATPTPDATPAPEVYSPVVVAPPTAAPPAPAPQSPPVETGPPRIGLQVGHWRSHELPDELSRLRGATGGSGGGVREVDVNLAVTERLAVRLRERGYTVDVLPATVPPAYRADVFLAIHADASTSGTPNGFKLARSRWTRLPTTDDHLVQALTVEYGASTGLAWSDAITRNMTGYYAFNNRRRMHAIDPATPAAILEMGYLTHAGDRTFLLEQMDRVVAGIEQGVVRFLNERPAPGEREQPAATGLVITTAAGGATAYAAPSFGAAVLATLEGGRRQEAPEVQGDWFGIWVTEVNGPGWVHRSQAQLETITLP